MQEMDQPYKSVVFPEFTIHCLRREGAKFMSVSNTAKGDYEYPVPIIDRTQKEPPHFFGVCIAPFYGTEPKWLQIAEFIEHYKIQGATYFYAYTAYIDKYSRIILDDYVRTGDVDNVVLHDRLGRTHNRWHTMEIQECLNRARGHSRWVAFVDLDERLMPTEFDGTLVDYLRSITDEKIGSIEFRQRWILKNETLPDRYIDSKQIDEWMPTRRWRNTSHVGPAGHTAKCIIDPKKVLIMNIHHVTSFYNFDEYRTYGLKPEEGVVRHYRDLASGNWGKNWLKSIEKMGEFSMTSYPEKWMDELRANVQKRVHHVYGPIIPKPKLN